MLVRGLARIIVCGSAAMATLVIFAMTALKDQTATSATAGALCLAFAVLSVLDLESFEGLGIKAKLRNTLSDAERRLEGIDKIISTLAQQAFTHASSGNVDMYDGKVMIEDLTASLKAMSFSPAQIDELKIQSYKTVGVYLWNIYLFIAKKYIMTTYNRLSLEEINTSDASKKKSLSDEKIRIGRIDLVYDYKADYRDFRKQIVGSINQIPLNEEKDHAVFLKIASNISDIYEGCLKSGGYTNESIQIIKHMESGYDKFMPDTIKNLSQ